MTDKTAPQEMTELDGADIYPNWDSLVQGDTGTAGQGQGSVGSELDFSTDMLLDEKGQDYWEELFNKMHFPGMDLMAAVRVSTYLPDPIKEHTIFKNKIRQFLKKISEENVKDLRTAGIAESNIFAMTRGIMPVNWTVHLKYPLEYGGTLDFDNMVLIQSNPFHEEIHTFINKQILSKAGVAKPNELYIPVPPGVVYVPVSVNLVGGGGKAAASISGKVNGGR